MGQSAPPDRDETQALLAAYAAGALSPHLHALVGAHLALSDANRAAVLALERTAGADIDAMPSPRPLRAARDHMLAAIYAGGYYGRGRPIERDPELPEALYRLTGAGLDALDWRPAGPGFRAARLPFDGVCDGLFLMGEPCAIVPEHGHAGLEAVLALRGEFTDGGRRYVRGDVAVARGPEPHSPVVGEDGCVCFVVQERGTSRVP
ncbi:hypothetical protein ACFQ4O_05620 [Methylopila musalis]|uniref:ChrR-like cupin domain-containing protein n=1 Tax=Methylopila musalis TaxID=1134781 RepID=A0ABW3Z5N6_9HYPH